MRTFGFRASLRRPVRRPAIVISPARKFPSASASSCSILPVTPAGSTACTPREADDIVQWALVALFNPETARFDPTRGSGNRVEAYLRGLIQNAARKHARFVRRGSTISVTTYCRAANTERGLPTRSSHSATHGTGLVVADRDVVSALFEWLARTSAS